MITKNHPSAYADLFAKATEALRAHGSTDAFKNATIVNIDDYFACLAELARIENDPNIKNIDPIFTILPATEQTFDIDANKRTISIPENFAKYGVGVQGDEIAEILYFSIDRYFDAMDLAEMDIIVQWKYEKDNDLASNLSATYKKSLTLQPGKIVFGWPITSEITSRSGNIKYSIRFYRRNEETSSLEYSFSTLTSTIKIQAGLDFDLDVNSTNLAIDKSQMIYNNLRNSKKANVGYVIAVPQFVDYYTQMDTELVPANENRTYDLPVTFVTKAEIPIDKPEDSYVSGSGLSYKWYEKGNTNPLSSSHFYKKVNPQEEQYNPNEIYYTLENNEYVPYYVVGDNDPLNDTINGEPITLYTRHSAFTPTVAGIYQTIANNTYVPGSSASAVSGEWVVPSPQEPLFDYHGNEKYILDENSEATIIIDASAEPEDQLTTSWYVVKEDKNELIPDASGNTYVVKDEGYYFMKAKNVRNNAEIEVESKKIWVRHKASVPVIKAHYINGVAKVDNPISANVDDILEIEVLPPQYGDITYQWFKDGEMISTRNVMNTEYQALAAGTYYCVITNTYKETVETVTSYEFRVSAK